MVTPEQQRLADRILKLLALANSTTFAAEAATARAMAAELMERHNIAVSVDGKPGQDAIEWRYHVPWAKGARWEGIIIAAISDLCSCATFFNHRDYASYALVGSVGDLDMLQYMLGEVNRQRIRSWLDYKMSAQPDSFHKFCYGFAVALRERIDGMLDMALLEPRHEALALWYETNVLHRKLNKHSLSMGNASSAAGREAGEGASLHRGSLGQAQRQLPRR